METRKEKRNMNYWLWRWAKLGPAGRVASAVVAMLALGPAAIILAAMGVFVMGLIWACTLWRVDYDPQEFYNQECRRNDMIGHGYRVYWPGIRRAGVTYPYGHRAGKE